MAKLFFLLFFTLFLNAKNLLILNSYSSTLQWTKEQSESIVDAFENDETIKIYQEFMGTKVFKLTAHNQKNLFNYYKNKYKNTKIDIVTATDDNALQFIMKYKNELFKESKVFFTGVNNLALAKTLDTNTYAGVFEEKDPISNLKIAKTINPQLKTIYLISDNSVTAKKEIVHYKESFKDIDNIQFIYLNENDINTISNQLQKYDENSIMMLLVFTSFTQNNKYINEKKAVKILSKQYKNPMLIHTNTYINLPHSNVVAGNCTCGQSSGKAVSNYIKQYLQGKSMKDIGFDFTETNKIYINHKNLKLFDIEASIFNKFDPIHINEKLSFYDQYKFYISFFIFISIISIVFMIILMKKNKAIHILNNSLEIKITQALQQLEEQHQEHQKENIRNTKFSTIGQMAAGITHEINTPLTYIKGTVEMMQFDIEEIENETIKKTLLTDHQKISSGLNRIAMIVESMREMSQTMPQKTEEVNIYSTVITMLRMSHNRSLHLTKIYVNDELFDLENSDKERYSFMTKCERQRIEQVWTILLNNSFDELIKIENFDDRKISINISNDNDKIKVVFCDNAGGIDERIFANIFEPFESTKESSGIGIGLNVAKKIIEEHQGTITAQNRDGGACFTVII